MQDSDRTDRPNRVVMFLGIATIVLFSANLMSVLANRVWPRLQHMIATETSVPEARPDRRIRSTIVATRFPLGHMTFRFENRMKFKKKRCWNRHAFESNDRMDAAIEQLERDIQRESDRIEIELQNVKETIF